jgi:hypothetical protein
MNRLVVLQNLGYKGENVRVAGPPVIDDIRVADAPARQGACVKKEHKDLGQVEKPGRGQLNTWHVVGSLWLLVGMLSYQGDLLNYGFGAIFLLPSAVLIGIGENIRPMVGATASSNTEHIEISPEPVVRELTSNKPTAYEEAVAYRDWLKELDSETQLRPHIYDCIGHPNRTLALRYGIANLVSDSDKLIPADHIELRRIKKVAEDENGVHYHAELPAFANRIVRVVIRPGTDLILTFYPMSPSWFEEHADLEELLKDNKTFTLKELAVFHVQEVLRAKDRQRRT